MASPKQYKNVYTILEKVRKGEIQSYYKDDTDGLFGKINFYKKPDLIKPHLHYLDEKRLENIITAYIHDSNTIKDNYKRFKESSEFKAIPEGMKPNVENYIEKYKKNYAKFPKHIKNDIFKMFYHKIDKLNFEERTDQNYTKYKFLEKANNPVSKIMTETSNLKSAIFARNILGYFLTRMTAMEYIDPQSSNNIQQSMDGESEFNNEGVDNALDKMLDSKSSKDMLDQAIKDATETCNKIDDVMDEETQENFFNNASLGAGEASKLNGDFINNITSSLERINLSLGSLKEQIKKLMDKSTNYFSARKEVIYDDLFNSDNVAGLEDYIMLHPKLRKIFAEDLQVKDTKSIGKIDIYIDISGSMSSYCGVINQKGDSISKIDFCKAFAAKLKSMDMLNEIFLFDNRVKKCRNDIVSISMIGCGGGTTIDAAVQNIEKEGRNALVITDAEDYCSIYSSKAFFIGVEGARFNYFNNNIIEEYSNKGQVVVFDGTRISKVDVEGKII